MEKKTVNIAGYSVTQLTETEYEIENPEQELDFHFDAEDPKEVAIVIFDSLIPSEMVEQAELGVVYASSLEEAVTKAMQFTKANIKEIGMWS